MIIEIIVLVVVPYFIIGFLITLISSGPYGYHEEFEALGVFLLWPLFAVKFVIWLLCVCFKHIFIVASVPRIIGCGLWYGFKSLIFRWDL